ncbi:HAD-IIA family hydrolase [Ornithinicoccus halotolerans]|uniref:HAD-IIA family hydrolase n=1 Tax=Ornithinicoccus halotolerans TaxID=1748220 RepID=UPI001E649C22|nr:HAD-IIA family hydrolase [Ornithinicoccus halotolerans]
MSVEHGSVRGLICDLDGVVYRGSQPCPGAIEGLTEARQRGIAILYLTNNAGHTAAGIAERLAGMGVPAMEAEVLTSSQVAADEVAEHPERDEARRVLAVGGPGVRRALLDRGVATVTAGELAGGEEPVPWAVVQGYGTDVTVTDLTEAVYAVRAGALWVATNTDATLPTPRGLAPGNGALLASVAHATGQQPGLIAGKPHAPAYRRALQLLGLRAEEVLAVGDRLETDIVGARTAGIPTALVLTGVHGREDVEQASPDHRPDVVVDSLHDLARWWG